jgi:molecular chaperone GrpE
MKKAKNNNLEKEMEMIDPDNYSGNVQDNSIENDKTAVENQVLEGSNESTAEPQDDNNFEKLKQDYVLQIIELKDKYIRLSAEFDNYRKRTLKEKIELSKFAGEDVLKSILPVIDDFERGIKNLEQAQDIDAVKEGIFLIYNKFREFIQQKGLKEIVAIDSEFNTDFHEAITKIPVEDKKKSGKIVDVVQKGYILEDKVIRFAKVVVGE